jgi:hypothetical protein
MFDGSRFPRFEQPPINRTPVGNGTKLSYEKTQRVQFGGVIGSWERRQLRLVLHRHPLYCTAYRRLFVVVSAQNGTTLYPLATENLQPGFVLVRRTGRFLWDDSEWPGCVCGARRGAGGCVLWWCNCGAPDCTGLLHCPAFMTAACGRTADGLTLERFLPENAGSLHNAAYPISSHGPAAPAGRRHHHATGEVV